MSDTHASAQAIQRLPALLEPAARNWFERFDERYPDVGIAACNADAVVRIAAVSEFAAGWLLRDWPWLRANLDALSQPFDRAGVAALADEIAASDADVADVKQRLRTIRHRQLFGVLWRDLSGLASVDEGIEALSDIADELLRAAACYAQARLAERCGRVRNGHGEVVDLIIIAMGKLGGRELNFSSDVDVIFAYASGGSSDGERSLDAQTYFDRLSREVVALMDEVTADGFVFRMDTRLRPFGESGPPVVSFAALESYLLQHGRDWERYAYVKARLVGPLPPEAVERALFDELILPFVYRRYLDYGVFQSLREMHGRIAVEVKREDRADDVKLGPGGIREVEFLVQSLQLVRGGSLPELKTPSLLTVLPLLVKARSIDRAAAERLLDAYRWLRRLENLIQAVGDKQIHTLPTDPVNRERLVFALGLDDWQALKDTFEHQRSVVATQFGTVAFPDRRETLDASDYRALWSSSADKERWRAELEDRGVGDAAAVAARVAEFRSLAVARKADNLSRERLDAFVPIMLRLAEKLDDAATAVDRCLAVVEQILRRSAYLALLNENPAAARRLITLCERSAYIADQIASFPVLLDELLEPAELHGVLGRAEIQADLDAVVARHEEADAETQMEAIARFQRAVMFRIAVADFGGELPIMRVSDSLTFLAESVLEVTLDLAWADLAGRHGTPHFELEGDRHAAGFGIIAYGKLGGLEMSYGSDLDIVFVHDSCGREQVTDGEKPLDNAVFFNRLVRRLVHFLGTRTRTGQLYEVDTRLRPSGRKGLLVTSLDAFERYQQENAWTWEHQALLRARVVTGTDSVSRAFRRIRRETLESRVRRDSLRDDVLQMRAKMRGTLDRSDAGQFDLKQGAGGIGDIEFLVQYLVLAQAGNSPAVIDYTDNIRQLDALAVAGVLTAEDAATLQRIYRLYRRREHRLVLNDRRALVPATELESERATVRSLWETHFGA